MSAVLFRPRLDIRPQPGPQEAFLRTQADLAIYGGSAGGGKSWALLLEGLRHVTTRPDFFAVFFRRTTKQVTNPGGLWDEAGKLYFQIPGAEPRGGNDLDWRFPGGGRIKFAHLEHEKNKMDWQGSQVPLLCFDELTHFTESQFWYMLSRNRSMSGVRPYVRATCNPDADSWVARLIEWWIDQDTGLSIPSRSGKVRWFVRVNDRMEWADNPAELKLKFPDSQPKSLTFIAAKLTDNAALMAADPGYMANLMALPAVERGRLLGGNWKIRPAAGLYFQRSWLEAVEAIPPGTRFSRGWDLAATPKTADNDPDWTCGTKIGACPDGSFIVVDHVAFQDSPGNVRKRIRNTATQDGNGTAISIAQDPGQAGKAQVEDYRRELAAFNVRFSPENGDKVTRFGPFSAQCEAGGVRYLKGAWNDRWLDALEAFPEAAHDDDVDSTSRAYEIASRKDVDVVRRFGAY